MKIEINLIKLLFLVIGLNILGHNSLAQRKERGDTTVKSVSSDSISNKQLASKIDSLYAYLKADKADKQEQASTLCLGDSISRYSYTRNNKRTGREIVMDSATFLIKDGYIIDVRLHCGKTVYSNYDAPISLSPWGFSLTDRLYSKRGGEEYIVLEEFVSFDPLKGFAPDDGYITLSKKVPCVTLSRNVSVNTVFDIRVYTDALAAFGKEPNGIFQTSARFKQFIHRRHAINGSYTSLQYFKLNLNYSKLDSKQAFVDSEAVISRLGLLQRSTFSGELAINVFHCWTEKKSSNEFYLDFGAGFTKAKLAGLHDTSSISAQYLFLEAGFNLVTSSNIGFDVYTRPALQYSPQTSFNGQNKGYLLLTIGGEIFWNPFESPSSRLFGRMNYTLGTKLFEKKNSFSQVQVGYSVLLSKLISSK